MKATRRRWDVDVSRGPDTCAMDVRFVAGFAVITTDPVRDKGLFVKTLGLPLRPPVSVPDSEYLYSEDVAGAKHFGVWPLNEAAQNVPWPGHLAG